MNEILTERMKFEIRKETYNACQLIVDFASFAIRKTNYKKSIGNREKIRKKE